MRLTLLAAILIPFLTASAPAADNPLGASTGSKNPLGVDSPADPLAATFTSEKFSLLLKTEGPHQYTGVIKMAGKEFPATAAGTASALKGKFVSDGQSYEFAASLDGDTLTLSTGGATYALKKELATNPLANPQNMNGVAPAAGAGTPGKFEVIQSTATGQTLFESRDGAKSAKAILPDAINDLANYLGVKPTIARAFADTKDLRGGASFTAKVRDHAIKGMIFVGIGQKGGAITVVFDAADAPARNLSALAAAAIAPAELKWDDARLPDNSGTMKLPTGWRITGAANGAVDVVGPEGQAIELGLAYPVITPEADRQFRQQQIAIGMRPQPSSVPVAPYPNDPVSAVEAMTPVFSRLAQSAGAAPVTLVKIVESTPTPGMPGGKAAFVHAISDNGKPGETVRYHSVGVVSYAATGAGQWLYYTSYVAAPQATFARDLPTMMQIWASWKVSDQVLQGRLKKAMEDLKAAGEMTRQSQTQAAKVRSNSNADFDEVIRGYRTVEDTQTGERREANLGWSDKIVEKMNEHAGYERYKEIPLRDQ